MEKKLASLVNCVLLEVLRNRGVPVRVCQKGRVGRGVPAGVHWQSVVVWVVGGG